LTPSRAFFAPTLGHGNDPPSDALYVA